LTAFLPRQHSNFWVALRNCNTYVTGSTVCSDYEPPEFEDPESTGPQPRSRAYEIWSMGCVSLEMLIWLLWGHAKGLVVFNHKFPSESFWRVSSQRTSPSNSPRKKVHPAVSDAIQWMQELDFRCREGTAIGDLLSLIKNRLLVIQTNGENCRAKSREVLDELVQINQKNNDHILLS
jgi:serine/threonine protein kinase